MMSVATVLLSHLLLPIFKTYLRAGESGEATIRKPSGDTQRQIEAVPEAMSSITEETTRSFEPVPQERNRQESARTQHGNAIWTHQSADR